MNLTKELWQHIFKDYGSNIVPVQPEIQRLCVTVLLLLSGRSLVTLVFPGKGSSHRGDDEEAAEPQRPKYHDAFLLTAFIATTVTAGLTTTRGNQLWSGAVWPWMIYACHILAMYAATKTRQQFNTAVNAAATGLLAIIITGLPHELPETSSSSSPSALWIAILLSNVCVIGVLFLTPRSPDKEVCGRPIDRQQSASLLELATFSWSSHAFAPSKLDAVTLKQLPCLPIGSRAAHLADRYAKHARRHPGRSLGFLLLRSHFSGVALQWTLVIAKSAVILVPDYCQYRLLQWLGSEHDPGVYGPGLCWALALGLAKVLGIMVSSWLDWTTESMIRVPIMTTLRALVHRKAMHLPDAVDGAAKDGGVSSHNDTLEEMRSHCHKACFFFTETHKVAFFLDKLVSTAGFLVVLVGWKSLTAGVVASALIMPVNTYFSRKYAISQGAAASSQWKRSSALTTALHAMRQIKLSAAEGLWMDRLRSLRREQMTQLLKASTWMSALVLSANISPMILAGVPVYIFTLQGQKLTTDIAFTTISLFDSMQASLSFLPLRWPYLLDYWRSLSRLGLLLSTREIVDGNVTPANTVSLNSATATWCGNSIDDEKYFALDNLSMEFPDGELSVVTGKTGSGKSLLLTAIAGEAKLAAGSVHRPFSHSEDPELASADGSFSATSLAIVTQSPWMENATIRDNILFSLSYDENRYRKAVYSCALAQDFSRLKDGDGTVVGIKGVTLSGGQRWRVALARALYSRARLILLDDVLSAVDAEIRDWITEKALFGDLIQGRTRILVTHHADQCLAKAAYHVHLEDGRAVSQRRLSPSTEADCEPLPSEPPVIGDNGTRQDVAARLAQNITHLGDKKPQVAVIKSKYRVYFDAVGGIPVLLAAVFSTAVLELIYLAQSWQLMEWSTPQKHMQQAGTYRGLRYMVFAAIRCIGIAVWNYFQTTTGFHASQELFDSMSVSLFGAPLQWLEGASHGEITNRFSSDMRRADQILPDSVGQVIKGVFQLAIILVASTTASTSLYDVTVVAALLYCYFIVWRQSNSATKKFATLSSGATASLHQHLSSLQAPDAILTIRAYGMAGYYSRLMYQLIDDCSATSWNEDLCRIMVDFRAGILGVVFVTYSAVCVVVLGTEVGAAGVALAFAMPFGTVATQFLQRITEVESGFNSIERIVEYSNLPQEPKSGIRPPASWPTSGKVDIADLTAGYRPGLPPALKNISFSVNPGQRIGVVGRTGAGKSSLTLAFARLIHFRAGSITIDGIDISAAQTDSLRKALLIIPQDPYLFAGSLRSMLDPDGLHTDETLSSCLRSVGLSESTTPGQRSLTDLSLELDDGGRNISQGQRQMLYLAKALLSGKKLIIMDEATSSVDTGTDAAIQAAIRTALPTTTVIVVAHRLATIVDFDKIIVLKDGELAEFGPPRALYQQQGVFFNLVNHSQDREELVVKMKAD